MQQQKIFQIKYDRLFRDLFNEKEMNTIEWTVMQILGCSYDDIHGKVKVGNIKLPNINSKEKNKYVDLIVEYNGKRIIIELNNNYNGNYKRNLLYAFNAILGSYKTGINVEEVDIKVILVNLNWHRRSNMEYNKKVIDYPYPDEYVNGDYFIRIINVNLDYYDKVCYDEISYQDTLWKLLTIKSPEELDTLTKREELLKNYQNKLLSLSTDNKYTEDIMDEDIERNVEREVAYRERKRAIEEGYQEGIEKGIEQGIEQGLKEGAINSKREIVLNMYKKNLPVETISECTNLEVMEVESIINERKN